MKGNIIYLTVSALFGIVVAYSSFRSFALLLFLAYLAFLFLRKRNLFFYCLISSVSFYVYFLYIDGKNQTTLSGNETTFSARLIVPVDIDGDRLKVIGETARHEKVQIIYRLASQEEQQQLSRLTVGVVCSFQGTLEAPEPARNPYAFDYQKYLRFQRIHWLVKPRNLDIRHCYSTDLNWYEQLMIIRQKGIDYIERHFPSSTVGIVQALVYGERKEMDETILKGYQQLGLVHLLAISGLQVTMLTGACFYLAIRAGMTRETAALILLFLLPVYMILTGASPSVVRASLMAMLVLMSVKSSAKMLAIDAVSLTCLIMLFFDPYMLFQPGFQLSFVVSFTLILSAHTVLQYSSPFWQLFVTTLIAQLTSIPFLLYHFFEISLLSLPLNIVFIPLYSFVILPLSLLALSLHILFAPAGKFIILLLDQVLTWTNKLVKLLSLQAPFTFNFGRPSAFLLCLYCFAILFVFVELERKQKGLTKYRGWIVLGAVFIIHWVSPHIDRHGEVVLLDVGQGDCIYIELPYRKSVYLIDTGGVAQFEREEWQKRKNEFEVGTDIVIPFLKAKGVRQLDKLIVTHGDYDHMGAAQTIIEQIAVKELLVGKGGRKDGLQARLIAKANERHIQVKEVMSGSYWKEEGITFYVLAPNKDEDEENRNNRSVVVYAMLGGLYWLFTGDLEKEGEEQLIRTFPSLKVDVLKVGHHGSETSTSEVFVKKLRPRLALISVGKHNRYHHPHEEVLKRLQAHRVAVLRTDVHGAIQFVYTKKSGTFTTMLP